jgi:hypothetical protein
MKRTWTIIGVKDVPGSFQWYQALFGQSATLPAHDDFGQIVDSDGTVLLCLHEWGAHGHPSLMSPDQGPPGNGLLLFFRVDDFDLALQRARSLVNRTREPEHTNEGVLSPRSGRILRYDQCALCGLTRRCKTDDGWSRLRERPICGESLQFKAPCTLIDSRACAIS